MVYTFEMSPIQLLFSLRRYLFRRTPWKTVVTILLICWNMWLLTDMLSAGPSQDEGTGESFDEQQNMAERANGEAFNDGSDRIENDNFDYRQKKPVGVEINLDNFRRNLRKPPKVISGPNGNVGIQILAGGKVKSGNQAYALEAVDRSDQSLPAVNIDDLKWKEIEQTGLDVATPPSDTPVQIAFQVSSKKSFILARRMITSILLTTSAEIRFILFSDLPTSALGKEVYKLPEELRTRLKMSFYPLKCDELSQKLSHLGIPKKELVPKLLNTYDCLMYTIVKHSRVEEAIIVDERAIFLNDIAKLWGVAIAVREVHSVAALAFSKEKGFAFSFQDDALGFVILDVKKFMEEDLMERFLQFQYLRFDNDFTFLRRYFKNHPNRAFPVPCEWRFSDFLDGCYRSPDGCPSAYTNGIKMFLGCDYNSKEALSSKPLCTSFEDYDPDVQIPESHFSFAILDYIKNREQASCQGDHEKLVANWKRLGRSVL